MLANLASLASFFTLLLEKIISPERIKRAEREVDL